MSSENIDPIALVAEFGIRASQATRAPHSNLAAVYIIDDAYVLRARHLSRSLDDILKNERELLVAVRRLFSIKFPELLSAQKGKKYIAEGANAWTLYPLIQGDTLCGWTELYYALDPDQWKRVFSFMRDLHEKTQGRIPLSEPRHGFARDVEKRLANVGDSISNFARTRIQRAIERVAEYEIRRTERCFVHGDIHPGNMIFSKGEITGLIDVDWCRAGLDLEDLAYLVMMAVRDYRKPCFETLDRDFFENCLNQYGLHQTDRSILDEYMVLYTLYDLDLFFSTPQMSKRSFFVEYQRGMVEKLCLTL